MKTTTIEMHKEKSSFYPIIARHIKSKNGPFIILFTSEVTGMVLQSDNKDHHIGEYSTSWLPCSDKTQWEMLSSIIIKFEE